MDLPSRPADRSGFHIAIICALTLESNAIDLLFDEIYDTEYGRAIGDNNTYTTGRVGNHAVVLIVLPNMGKDAAAAASAHMLSSFPNIKLALVVGICGGLPRIGDEEAFLGDVVISRSVVNYDFGRQYPDKFVVKSSVEDSLGKANKDIRGLLNLFDREHDLGVLRSKAVANLSRLQAAAVAKRQKAKYTMPPDDTDKLFLPDYQHAHRNKKCDVCAAHSMRFCEEASELSCDAAGCDLSLHKPRQNRQQKRPAKLVPQIFIGKVASGNAVMKSGQHRDKIAKEHEIIAFEMEGAGAWDKVPCIIVKGICDYADSHKNKQWQNLAAATAASVAVGILAKYEVAGAATYNYHKVGTNYYIPLLKNRYFVGRAEVLGRLEKKLFGEDDPPRVALVGLGGIGKTQVALQLAYLVQENKSGWSVFWVPALSMASFEQACVDIIGKLRVPHGEGESAKDTFRRHFSSPTAGKWLLIVDNADDWDTLLGQGNEGGINDYLPQSSRGRILFTTRSRKVATNVAKNNIVDLSEMSRGEARKFLEKLLVKANPLLPENTINEFLKELAYLPLAITQAVAYMNENQVSIAEYLKVIRNTDRDKVELLAAEFTNDTRYKETQNAVATTWIISFEQIRKINADAAKLLSFAACVEPKAIPRSMLPSVGTEQRMTKAIGLLCGYAFLVKRADGGIFDMHSLVHLAAREWVKGKGDTEKAMEDALAQLVTVFSSDKWENRERWRQYMPHAFKMLQADGAAREGGSEAMNRLRYWAGRCLRMDGRIRQAVNLLEQVVAIRGRTLSEEHPSRLASQHELARAYQADGQVKKAVDLLEHVVTVREKTLSEEHPSRLASQHALAGAYQADGQVKKAVTLHEHVLTIRAKTLAENHPDRLASQHALARAYAARSGNDQSRGRLHFSGEISGQSTPRATVSRYAGDSGYVSGTTGTSKGKEPSQLQSPIDEVSSQSQIPICKKAEGSAEGGGKQNQNDEVYFGGRYQYSKAGSVSEQRVGQFISEMARLLIRALPPSGLDDSTPQRLAPVLPRILRAFALMIGHCAPNATHQEVMFFVHKHQSAIVDRFRGTYAQSDGGDGNDSDDERPQNSIDQAQHRPPETLEDKMNRFFQSEKNAKAKTAVGETSKSSMIDEEHEQDSHNSEPADIHDLETSSMSEIIIYQDCVVRSSAYEWLRGALSAEVIQTPAVPDVRSRIRNTVLRALDSSRKEQKLSRTMPTEPHRVSFEMEWDPRSFVERQRYEEKTPGDAIGMAITLTGSSQDCQATTTSQYLSQAWPSGGSHMMQVIRCLLRGEPGDRQTATWPDQTTLTVQSNGPKLMVTAYGPAPSVAEISEQLAWVGAALRPSPQERGVCYCTPYVKYLGERGSPDPTPGTSATIESSFVIGFNLTSVDEEGANGQCWHDMFRNPVVVCGYPILRRTATQTGLEMPLNMMARMVRADHLMPFGSTWYFKGFSSMLALTGSRDDVFLWHHIYDRDGDHVSYFDHTANSPMDIAVSQLQNARHVVGWCSDVKLYAGALEDVNYKIRDSGLSRPHATWILEKLSISGGKFVSGGISIAVGVRDSPIRLSKDSYRAKMRWVDGQHAILWDEEDKRGWLVNGASALLHMVRASLEDDIEWTRRRVGLSDILFNKDAIEGPKQPHTPDSALSVLLNEKNKRLKIFKEVDESDDEKPQPKTTYKRFKDVVEEQYDLFEQMVDHQRCTKDGVDLKPRVRRCLVGWDFRDLTVTAKTEPINARLKTFKTVTRSCWVDFTKERKVITIFGKGFGDIIRPVDAASMCGFWARVPAGRCYLAACVSDLKAVMKLGDDEHHCATPIPVCRSLYWHATDRLFRPCRCGKMTGEDVKHSDDIAQVIVPSGMLFQKTPKTNGSVELGNMGAIIFGLSSEEEVVAETPGEARDFRDSGIGTSPAPTATGGSSSRAQASTRPPDRTAAPVRVGEASGAIAAAGPSRAQESSGQADKGVPPDQHAPGESSRRAADDRIDVPVEGLPGRTDGDVDKSASSHGTAQPPTAAPRSHEEQITPEEAAEHGGTAQSNVPRRGIRARLKLWLAKAKLALGLGQ